MPATTAQSLPLLQVCEENGCLTVFDHTTLPFAVQRVFTVQASAGALRGQHAHRFGTQALVALGYSEKDAAAALKLLPPDVGVSDGIKLAMKSLSR